MGGSYEPTELPLVTGLLLSLLATLASYLINISHSLLCLNPATVTSVLFAVSVPTLIFTFVWITAVKTIRTADLGLRAAIWLQAKFVSAGLSCGLG